MSAIVIALATILVIVIILFIVAISLLRARNRGKASSNRGPSSMLSPMTPSFGMRFVPPSHPASHITPFGSTPQRPIFNHKPGSNMRIAHRREDGGWDFSQPGFDSATLPRTPESAYSADGASPTSVIASSIWTQNYPVPSKVREVNRPPPALTAPPPPAYSREDNASSVRSHSLA